MRPIRFRSFVPFFAPGIRRCPVRPVLHAVPTRAEIHLTPIRGNPGVHAHQGLHAVDAAWAAGSRSAGRPACGATAPGKAVRHAGRDRKPFVSLRRRPDSVRVRSSAPGSVRVIAFDTLVAAVTAALQAPRWASMRRASGIGHRASGIGRRASGVGRRCVAYRASGIEPAHAPAELAARRRCERQSFRMCSARKSISSRTRGSSPRRDGNTACTTPPFGAQPGSTSTSVPSRRSSSTTMHGSCTMPTP